MSATTNDTLARALARKFPELGVTKSRAIVRTLSAMMGQALLQQAQVGDPAPRLKLQGLGVLSTHLTAPHPGVHPSTGTSITRPEKVRGRFSPSPQLADQLRAEFLDQA